MVFDNNDDLATRFEFLKYMPGFIDVSDIHYKSQSMSNDLAIFWGWNKSEEAVDKSYFDIPCKASEGAELLIYSAAKTIESGCKITAIQIFYDSFGMTSFLVQKYPIKNNKNVIIGVVCHAIDMPKSAIKQFELLSRTDKQFASKIQVLQQYILTPEVSPLPISARQQECLALLVRGKSMKEIAYILGVSPRTVETHFENIKHKLGCYNKGQLIEKAIDSGFLFHIPANFLGINLSQNP